MPSYEMLWDCAYCGTRKLLGKTHRFCPGCGAPQDPARRYFPPDEEKVAVENHEYVGADRTCGACSSAMSAKAAHCTQCGAPMEGAREVGRVDESLSPQAPQAMGFVGGGAGTEAQAQATRPVGRQGGRGCLLTGVAGAALVVAGVLIAVFWRKEVEVRVTGHSWERSVTIERLEPKQESAWCEAMPGEAYRVTRQREVRDKRRAPDGEDCHTKNVDQRDGTFRQEQECAPRYREEPVYDMRCSYTVDRWQSERSVRAEGQGLSPAPSWPSLAMAAGECRGCEREGPRRESYKVQLSSATGKAFTCELDEGTWRSLAPDSRWRLSVGVVSGGAACGSLQAR